MKIRINLTGWDVCANCLAHEYTKMFIPIIKTLSDFSTFLHQASFKINHAIETCVVAT